MSMSGADFNGVGEDPRIFRNICRDRILKDMLKPDKDKENKSAWKVLIMDKFTVRIMGYACKMAEITDAGVSLVEDLFKRREPMPSMDVIYFVQPLKENVIMLLSDMSGRCPLYRKAYIFFSSPIPKDLVTYIKNDSSVIPRIGALREMNLEFFAIDMQGFVTDHDMALTDLYGANEHNSKKFNDTISTMACRIATTFASLKEFPTVRYRAPKSADPSTAPKFDMVPKWLANATWEIVSKYKSTIPEFPQKETCELLVLDRPIDQIAPVIHEWTYDAMCHDLLEMDGNKYIYEVSKEDSEPEKKEALLEDQDPLWIELRHIHIADASERLYEKMNTFVSKNKAAQLHSRDGGEISTTDLQKIVQALPQYGEQVDKLTLHIDIAGKINRCIRDYGLRDLGQLEQDLVFGDAGAKEVINMLRSKQNLSEENKLRLMIIYAIVCPDKFEGDKGDKLMQLAKLPSDDMKAINSLRYLVSSDAKKAARDGGFSLKFDAQKKKNTGVRTERQDGEEGWALSRFFPLMEELVEKLSKGELPLNEYPSLSQPSSTSQGAGESASAPKPAQNPQPMSRRSRRTPQWAKGRNSDDSQSSDSSVLRHASGDFKRLGNRIFVFIVGGATRSELRVAHKLTMKLKREIVLGSSSIDNPPQFISKLKALGPS
ncbi:probable protein transport Sec1b [Triticum urartu]|uniref:SNARE-interacting protein KEULE n=1 Tax=Triticum urartu TaxID=4572 RepID=A0A8R7U3U0_TRIUA|nr:probable protein transport Sec1b [Triticum urartu]XP_048547984.1 probable protein transport Sec1b [Triticum urartu]XP_048568927.1 probable protein transport Sec1b [Triticum urartu]